MKQKLILIAFLLQITFMASNVRSQWVQTTAPHNAWETCFFVDGDNIYAGTSNHGILLSTNSGVSWKDIGNSFFDTIPIFCFTKIGNTIITGTTKGLFLSSDTGKTWTTTVEYMRNIHCLAVIGTKIIAGGYDSFVSSDSGMSWTELDFHFQTNDFNRFAVNGTSLFATTSSVDSILVSTDFGSSWKRLGFIGIFKCIISNGSDLFVGRSNQVCHSTDNGITWKVCSMLGDFNEVHTIYALAVIGKNLFAGTDAGIFLSSDSGTSWMKFNTGLTDSISVTTFGVSTSYFFAGTDKDGIWKHPLAGLDVKQKYIANPLNISLFPNPTNGVITIYGAPENTSQVTIANILGEKVLELTNPHSSNFTIDLSKQAPGIYYAKFVTTNSVVVKKILLQ